MRTNIAKLFLADSQADSHIAVALSPQFLPHVPARPLLPPFRQEHPGSSRTVFMTRLINRNVICHFPKIVFTKTYS
jgi:hypothetical protein